MGYIWFVKSGRSIGFDLQRIKKWFVIRDPQSPNSIPEQLMNCVHTAISGSVDISEVPGCHLLRQISCQWGSQKWIQRLVSPELTAQRSIFDLFLTHEMTILSKGCKADNLESHSSLKLSFTNIIDFHLNFVECESFLE